MPDVSFIVTVYNKSAYLAACLDAIVAQDGIGSSEIIFVDDGSTDGSGALLDRLIAARGHSNVRIVRQTNAGPGPATNAGARAACGEWLKLVDADDVLAAWATGLLIDEARRLDLGLVYGGMGWFGAEGPRFAARPADPQTRVFADPVVEALTTCQSGASNLLVRRDLFLAAGGCDERVFIQDQGICPRVAAVPGTRIGVFDAVVCLGPADEPGRLMKNDAQILHDETLTALNFLRDHPELGAAPRLAAFRRCADRAWKRGRKLFGVGPLSLAHLAYLQAKAGILWRHEESIAATLAIYRAGGRVRLSRPPGPSGSA
ncbi:MAG: glycosyltransferase family 2 protein [Proteobacteria bacterium]|nr:glycosyltransferase family 2 protein [Pseudomonadota bacterium]